MTDVTVPPNTQIRVTIANDITIFPGKSIAGNGGGGGVQFEILNPPTDDEIWRAWFTNPRKLK